MHLKNDRYIQKHRALVTIGLPGQFIKEGNVNELKSLFFSLNNLSDLIKPDYHKIIRRQN